MRPSSLKYACLPVIDFWSVTSLSVCSTYCSKCPVLKIEPRGGGGDIVYFSFYICYVTGLLKTNK